MHASTLAWVLVAGPIAMAWGCSSAPGSPSAPGEGPIASLGQADPLPKGGVKQISLNYADTCALLQDGAIACWGRNTSGQLGNGLASTGANPAPRVVPGISGALAIAIGSAHACAVVASGDVSCWGDDFFGELGDGTRTDALHPQAALGLRGITGVTTGGSFTCSVGLGRVSCWGTDYFGELGDRGARTLSTMAVPIPAVDGAAVVVAGEEHACALLSSGRVACWGSNDCGQVSRGASSGEIAPVEVAGVSGAVAIAAGLVHTCALRMDGSVVCWGYDRYGTLGDGASTEAMRPARAVSGISDAKAVAAGGYETCALHRGGEVSCWGRNDSGQLGDGTVVDAATPVRVDGLCDAEAIAVGDGHACALRANGAMVCWGANDAGQLGDGTTVERHVPTPVVGLP